MKIIIHRGKAKDSDAAIAARDRLLKTLVEAGRACLQFKIAIKESGETFPAIMDIERAIDTAYQKTGTYR